MCIKRQLDKQIVWNIAIKNNELGCPGGTVVKNPPANAGDMGSSPGLGRSHVPWNNLARAPQLLSLHSRACEPQLLKPTRSRAGVSQLLSPRDATTEAHAPRAHAPQQEKPSQ